MNASDLVSTEIPDTVVMEASSLIVNDKMTMTDLCKNPDPQTKRFLNYVSELASNVSVDISSWDMKELFHKDGGFIQSPTEINRIFFERSKVLTQAQEIKALGENDIIRLNVIGQGFVNAEKQRIESLLEQNRRGLVSNLKNQEILITDIQKHRDQMESLKPLDLTQIVEGILKLGFFKLNGIDTLNKLVKFTTDPVFITYKRKDKLEMKLPMGKYLIKFYPINGRMQLQTESNNVWSDRGYWHPFVSTNGAICFGNAQPRVDDLLIERRYPEVFKILQSLLTTYVHENPFETFEAFYFGGQNEHRYNTWITDEHRKITDTGFPIRAASRSVDEPYRRTEPPEDFEEESPICSHCDGDHESSDCINECDDCGAEYHPDDGHTCADGE